MADNNIQEQEEIVVPNFPPLTLPQEENPALDDIPTINPTSVRIELYQYSGEPNVIFKQNSDLYTKITSVSGTFKEPFDLINPTVTIFGMNKLKYNYASIVMYYDNNETHTRYYFVNDIVRINSLVSEVSLTLDVLETYRWEIISSYAFVERNEFTYSNRLPDDKRVIFEGLKTPTIIKKDVTIFDVEDDTYGSYIINGFGISAVTEGE